MHCILGAISMIFLFKIDILCFAHCFTVIFTVSRYNILIQDTYLNNFFELLTELNRARRNQIKTAYLLNIHENEVLSNQILGPIKQSRRKAIF